MLGITRFITCRPPGSMKKRSDWRVHSPGARRGDLSEDTALYYMDEEQWAAVQVRIDKADSTRQRDYKEWFEVQRTCYSAVWRIIFPRAEYPGLPEPISPFHPDGDEIANLSKQGQTMIEVVFDDNARQAVDSQAAESVKDFRPDRDQCISMMAGVFATVIANSPGAAQWVVNSSSGTLRDAVASRNLENDTPPTASSNRPERDPETCHPLEEPELSELVPSSKQEPSFNPLSDITAQNGSLGHMQLPPSYAQQVNQMPMFMPVMCMVPVASTTQISQLVAASTDVPTLLSGTSLESISSVVATETLGIDYVADEMNHQDHIFPPHLAMDTPPNTQFSDKAEGNEAGELDIDWPRLLQAGYENAFPFS
ncbi:hypothetical protein ACHAPJ_007634 [Fusarium lateritium]